MQAGQLQTQSLQPNLQISDSLWKRTMDAQAATYAERQSGVQSKMEQSADEIRSVAAKVQQGGGLDAALEGVAKGIQAFGQTMAQVQEQKAKIAAAKAEEMAQLKKENSALAKADIFSALPEMLHAAGQELASSVDSEGFWTTQQKIDQFIDSYAANLTPEDITEIRRYAYSEMSGIQGQQLQRQQTNQREVEAKTVDGIIANFKLSTIETAATLKTTTDPTVSTQLVTNILGQIDEVIKGLPQGMSAQSVLEVRNQLLNYSLVSVGDNVLAREKLNKAQQDQIAWQKAANDIIVKYKDNPQQRDDLLRQLRASFTGEVETAVTSENDVYREAATGLELIDQIKKLTTPEAPQVGVLATHETSRLVYMDLTGQQSIEQLKPGADGRNAQYQDTYVQLENARNTVRDRLAKKDQIRSDQITVYQQYRDAEAKVNVLRTLMAPQPGESQEDYDKRILAAQASGTISSRDQIALTYERASAELEALKIRDAELKRQEAENSAVLGQFGFQDGLSGWESWYNSDENKALRSKGMQAAGQLSGAASNFNIEPSPSVPRASALSSVGHVDAATGVNLNGVLAPFSQSEISSSQVYITALDKEGSHAKGNAVDFAVAGNPSGVGVSSLRGGTVVSAAGGAVEGDTMAGGGYGNYAVVQSPDGTYFLYAHLDQLGVKIGQQVGQGTVLGTMGNTGQSGGTHVHVSAWSGHPFKGGSPVPYADWLTGLASEPSSRNFQSPASTTGMPPSIQPRQGTATNEAMQRLAPDEAVVLPSGAYYMNGQFYYPSPEQRIEARTTAGGGNLPAAPIGVEASSVVNPAAPLSQNRMSNRRSMYNNPNPENGNYGYAYIRDNAQFRVDLNSTARQLGIPTQWLADIIATATGGTFNPGQNGKGTGLILFSESLAQSLGTSAETLARMTPSQQLPFVYRYFAGSHGEYAGKYDTIDQLWMSLWYNKEVAFKQPSYWVNNEAMRTGVQWMRRIGNQVGRQYVTNVDTFDPHILHNGYHSGCPTCEALYRADGRTTTGQQAGSAATGNRSVATRTLPPRQAAFLDVIAMAEGTYEKGYQTNFGGEVGNAPWTSSPFRDSSSDAYGRYQAMSFSWREIMGDAPPTPENQDIFAIKSIVNKRQSGGVFNARTRNEFARFLFRLAPEWASFPADESNTGAYPDQGGYTTVDGLWKFFNERIAYYERASSSVLSHTSR